MKTRFSSRSILSLGETDYTNPLKPNSVGQLGLASQQIQNIIKQFSFFHVKNVFFHYSKYFLGFTCLHLLFLSLSTFRLILIANLITYYHLSDHGQTCIYSLQNTVRGPTCISSPQNTVRGPTCISSLQNTVSGPTCIYSLQNTVIGLTCISSPQNTVRVPTCISSLKNTVRPKTYLYIQSVEYSPTKDLPVYLVCRIQSDQGPTCISSLQNTVRPRTYLYIQSVEYSPTKDLPIDKDRLRIRRHFSS